MLRTGLIAASKGLHSCAIATGCTRVERLLIASTFIQVDRNLNTVRAPTARLEVYKWFQKTQSKLRGESVRPNAGAW
jgi:hypothetical protein